MIRVYLSIWELRIDDAVGSYIWHPIVDAVDALPPVAADTPRDQRTRWSAEYPDADADGVPNGDAVLVFVTGPNSGDFGTLQGVDMLPPFDLATPIAQIAQTTVDAVLTTLAAHGIPFPQVEGTATAGELLDRIVGLFSANQRLATTRFVGREAEFA